MKKNQHFLLTNSQVVHVENGQIAGGTIEIKDGKVMHIYAENDMLPNHVEQVDVREKYIIPGLIDMHCHIQETYAPHFVAAGVTTVRNTAGDREVLKPLLEAPLEAPTPMLYACDALIDGEPGLWGPTQPGNFVTDDPEAARKEVRRQANIGATFIKVYCLIRKDVLSAIVEEAKKHDLEVSCDLLHAKEVDARTAAELGVTWFEHASGFAQSVYPGWHVHADQSKWSHINWVEPDEEKIWTFCEEMLAFNVKLCPTLIVQDQAERLPNYWDPKNKISTSSEHYFAEHWQGLLKHAEAVQEQTGFLNTFIKKVAKTYAAMGGSVVAGSDTPALPGIYPGMSLHRELELFVEVGFTPLEALQAATVKAAESIALEKIGSIQEGYVANLVILEENPLENISHTQTIAQVVKGGTLYTEKDILAEGEKK